MQSSRPVAVYGLLFSVILIWALAWPISKIGLADMPPLWYTAIRFCVGFITTLFLMLYQQKIHLPKRRDLPMILSIGLLQMACFLILINAGLLFVDAGRSAILVYTTPFWVTPITVLFLNEKLTKVKAVGLMFGLVGVLLLFNPWGFDWSDYHTRLGNGLLLLAAISWAMSMIHTRYGTWHSPSWLLIPWQLLLATLFTLGIAYFFNPHPIIHWNSRLILTLLYNGIFATGFAYAALIYVSQRLAVIQTSIFLLGVPILGLLFSAIWLNEPITLAILLAITFIILGLATITLDRRLPDLSRLKSI